MLLLDNCASHKTKKTIETLARLQFPVIFTAPASFLAVPIEGIFGPIKLVDFTKIPNPELSVIPSKKIKKFTHKQNTMIKIA